MVNLGMVPDASTPRLNVLQEWITLSSLARRVGTHPRTLKRRLLELCPQVRAQVIRQARPGKAGWWRINLQLLERHVRDVPEADEPPDQVEVLASTVKRHERQIAVLCAKLEQLETRLTQAKHRP